MTNKPNLSRLLAFQKLLLAFSQVERVVDRQHKNGYIRENDTEHSYNLAMTAWFLASHFPRLDQGKVVKFALAHDLVEVHAGDTYIYADAELLASKSARKAAALEQLSQEWPDFPDLIETVRAYEERSSEEAKFVYALDKIMPMMLIYIGEGHTWKREGITLQRLHAVKKDKVAVSKDIKPYYDALYDLLLDSPHLIPKS
ncbi:MAG: Metal dependent phosphohydrolase [Candidatus Saccharibacteria bacterium]|nr:Metal dependent phosphohydrolase [Candidatus Saccharibacteria bacterium]